ncbi:hypothetical protein [Propionivibrio sp.]|nr:hypothetical protein [Propionivibrio sp.]MBK8745728.1 hypothetical protein [Propionivibrio sp.]
MRKRQPRVHPACGTLVVVAFYTLIAQMVGAGQLIEELFGLGTTTR